MRNFLILCLLAHAGTTTWSSNEKVSSISAGVQRPKTRRILLPRTGRRDIQRLFYLKNLLELNCLRHICSNANCKGSRCPVASNTAKPGDRNRHDQPYYNRMRNNQSPYRRRYPSDDRTIVIPPNFYFINPRVENLSRLTPTPNTHWGNLVKQNTDNVIYIQFPPQSEEVRTIEEQLAGDVSNYSNSDDMQKPKANVTTLHSYRQDVPANQVRQYEVEEIVDEYPIYQEKNPLYIIQKPTEEAVKNQSDNSVVKHFSNHRSRELVDDKPPNILYDDTKYVRITPPAVNQVQKTEQTTSSTTTAPILNKPTRPDILVLPSEPDESIEFQPETTQQQESRNPTTVSLSEVQTTAKLFSKGFVKSDTDWSFPEDTNTSPTVVNMFKTVEYFSESTINKADLTTPNFDEFTDHPLLFDLFKKIKPKDPAKSKNSRKMHFGDNQDEQRRSDILMNESDYYDYENTLSTSNYLEKLKENSSLLSIDPPRNLSSEAIIPLIPIVINDLREGKISQEAIPILSETFGKFWPTIMTLSNSTNLDMLPLLKMKDEKDLESIIETFLPETTTTTEKMETEFSKNLYYDLYDYDMDNYKDLYKDFADIQDVSPTDNRKRFEKDSVK